LGVDILHRLTDRIEIKAEGSENLLQLLEPHYLFFTTHYQRMHSISHVTNRQ
jgi:hypothetical protein